MKLTNSQEEYLKTIYLLENNNKKIRVTDIANKLKITKPSVNKAIKTLKELGVLEYEAYGDITLTEKGKETAKEKKKKQGILEMFFEVVLEISQDKAKEEAIAMKHAISPETIKKLEQYISEILNLGDLECGYNVESEKCRKCVRITAKNRMKKR